ILERSVRHRAFPLTRWPMLRVPATDPSADCIEKHLGRYFGTEVRVGVLLGTRRVNQKPVLQVFDLAGRVQGYAKVGHNPLTAALVQHEARSLAAVGALGPRSFRVPQLLRHDQWSGLDVLVMSALDTDPGHRVPRGTRLAAMREVAHLAGVTTRPLADSGFWARLHGAAQVLPDDSDGAFLRAAARTIEQRHGAEAVSLGGWHGDWGGWNMGMGAGVLQLWDWERYDAEVPVGFDGLHFTAQSVRPGERDARRQAESFVQSVPETLAELGVPSEQHELTLRLYMLEMAVRYVEALTHGVTPELRRRTSWVLSMVETPPGHLPPTPSRGRS
ncbi:MAG: hypothetical protein LH477_06930, partial [Nocardioides sp.]|nr:hypothetical protein [Nocardioides sp.]